MRLYTNKLWSGVLRKMNCKKEFDPQSIENVGEFPGQVREIPNADLPSISIVLSADHTRWLSTCWDEEYLYIFYKLFFKSNQIKIGIYILNTHAQSETV